MEAQNFEMKNRHLVWVPNNEIENGGYYQCENCKSIYRQPKTWRPPDMYCMKCKIEWENLK